MRRESDTLRAGDQAPAFTLFDANGRAHSFNELIRGRADLEGRPLQAEGRARAGTLLLVFDRGTW
jgi:hypothetical protein